MSRCSWCKDVCSKSATANSHGICIHCQAQISPNSPRARRYFKAMARGHLKMRAAGLHTPAYFAQILSGEVSK